MGLFGLLKTGAKLGIVGGAVYVAQQENFFGTPEQTERAYNKFKVRGNLR